VIEAEKREGEEEKAVLVMVAVVVMFSVVVVVMGAVVGIAVLEVMLVVEDRAFLCVTRVLIRLVEGGWIC
jgi:hypothetical protein